MEYGDLISRQAAIELYEQFQPYIAVKAVDFKKALEQLPSAQPEQKKGEWIDEGQYADFFPDHAYRCSECGHYLLEIEVIYDFCPFCGADMRGEQDE